MQEGKAVGGFNFFAQEGLQAFIFGDEVVGVGQRIGLDGIDLIEDERQNGIFGDVARDVFFGVVGAHLLVIDILLEDVAEHVGVDFFVVSKRAVVQVPLVLVEEGEKFLEGGVGDLNSVAVFFLDAVRKEQAAVEVRHVAEQFGDVRRAGFLGKPFEEKRNEEVAVKVFVFEVSASKFLAEIVRVIVKEVLFLNEVNEHQAGNHDGSIPLLEFAVGNACNGVEEGFLFFAEDVVEFFG